MVETGGLENRFTRKGNGGSNPSPRREVCQLLSVCFAAQIKGIVVQNGIKQEHEAALSFLTPHGVVCKE